MAVVAALLGLLMARPPWQQFQAAADAFPWGLAASIPLLVALVLMVRYPVGPLRGLLKLTEEMIVPMFGQCSLVDLALIALAAGVGEEMLFRGAVQEAISHRFNPLTGLLAASTLFGLMHPISTTYVALAGLIGLYLGCLFQATGSLIAPITAHAVYDFLALAYLVRRPLSPR